MATGRVFTDRELLEAGQLTVDLIAGRLAQGDHAGAKDLLQRFQSELMTMFFSYTGWEKSILEYFAEFDGEARRDKVLAAVENWEIAPERKVEIPSTAQRWNEEISAILELIDAHSTAAATERSLELRRVALEFHDGMLSRVTALLSTLYEDHGEEVLMQVLNQVMKPESMDPDGKLPFREKVENIMHFTRCHLLPFTVTEDTEKVTFMPDPCPSGARLIRAGHYQSPRNGAIVRDAGPLTYGRKEIPVYCCHEPAMEMISALRTGTPLFLVEPPEDIGTSPCKIFVYKDPAQIPETYYRRLGLEKPGDLIARSGMG
ncbi:MAG: hypothetical protein OXC05_03825 [Halieaceae bacterium]|nr:hypothetical protein [Halieaceae bacterium]